MWCHEILYVGLPANRRHDLGGYSGGFRRVLSDVGRKRENVYRMCRKDSTTDFEHSSAGEIKGSSVAKLCSGGGYRFLDSHGSRYKRTLDL